ncbi:MAG: aspartate carbamoyltransferase [Clostridiales bacterium]|jgi:aspartate carbamoyltransferase catalytic subunit|nr:aspartate carbamoyltransferase [Clostridiales bacterium]
MNENYLISVEQFNRQSLEDLFNLAKDIKQNPSKYHDALSGKVIATLFYEPSTRTRLSFESAIARLGASNISTENAREFSSASKGETLEDTIRIIAGYSDAIVMRHYEDDSSEKAVKVSNVPIINAGAGKKEHPTQAILDVFTICEKFGTADNISILLGGDLKYGRTSHSLIKMLSLYKNVKLYGLSKPAFALPQEYIDFIHQNGMTYQAFTSFDEVPKDVNVIYHTRIQAERFEGDFGREEFIITQKVLDTFSKDTILLHPLPRCEEILPEVDNDPRAMYFVQAHNGIPTRMALLLKLLGE